MGEQTIIMTKFYGSNRDNLGLIINAGSSSLKFAVIDMTNSEFLLDGIGERLFEADATLNITIRGAKKTKQTIKYGSHKDAISALLDVLGYDFNPVLVAHRVVHGGEYFRDAMKVDADVKEKIKACSILAPLHNPANLAGIEAAEHSFANTPQYVIFDTAFHSTLPPEAYRYALPQSLYEQYSIRRYGFHGTSHHYVSGKTAVLMQRPLSTINMVVAHLGNGCSATAIAGGKSLDTTMGFTPLDGLVMGTRSGSLDPSILLFLEKEAGMSSSDLDDLLNKKSGLLGLSELSNDMRTLEEYALEGHKGAILAIEVFCFRLAKSIAGLMISLPSFDALVFTGGIGENSEVIRHKVCEKLKVLGLQIDTHLNVSVKDKADKISSSCSKTEVWVVGTDEELQIAQQAYALFGQETSL